MLPKEQWGNLEKAIGDLPSLEAGERGIEKYENDPIWSKKLNELKYHTAPYWPERDIEIMKHTATGCSAFDNPLEYRPTKRTERRRNITAQHIADRNGMTPFRVSLKNLMAWEE